MKIRKKIIITLVVLSISFSFVPAYAQNVEYPEGFAVDSDLDGLTDKGEESIFKTDPKKSDTDGDGYFDGLEVLNNTDPLDISSYLDVKPAKAVFEPSWPWYITRATALIAFTLLYAVIFLGLSIRFPILKKLIPPVKSFPVHAWLSVQALVFALAHGLSLMFEKFVHFSFTSVFVPFASEYETKMVALGTISFYVMILLILSSYFRHTMSRRVWRISHFLNIALYIIAMIHALTIGTDLKNPGIGRSIFLIANIILAMLFLANLSYQLFTTIKRKMDEKRINGTVQEAPNQEQKIQP